MLYVLIGILLFLLVLFGVIWFVFLPQLLADIFCSNVCHEQRIWTCYAVMDFVPYQNG